MPGFEPCDIGCPQVIAIGLKTDLLLELIPLVLFDCLICGYHYLSFEGDFKVISEFISFFYEKHNSLATVLPLPLSSLIFLYPVMSALIIN